MHNIKYQKYTLVQQKTDTQRDSESCSPKPVDQPSSNKKKVTVKSTEAKKLGESQEGLDPPPPPNISKEDLGLWFGWIHKKDREVVREAASKGYVPLATRFLSHRKHMDTGQTSEFIKGEVFLWVDELLNRKVILNVLRVLKNIKVDPINELQNVFYKTTNKDLRQYVGTYLKEKNVLPTNMEQLWNFLEIIIENKVLIYHSSLIEDSIESLDKKSDGWKDHVAAKLFLNTHDNRLVPMVKMNILWNQLLSSNEVHLLKAWIQIAYSSDPNILNIPENLLLVLKSFPITEEMIKDLESSDLPSDSFEKLVNDLAKYGIFIDADSSSCLNVLSRIDRADSIANIYKILEQKDSNLPPFKFISMLVDYCLENNLLTVLSSCTRNFDLSVVASLKNSPHLELMMDFRDLIPDFKETHFRNNIFNVSNYLSDGNLEKYFCDNPLIFLSLLLLSDDVSIEEALDNRSLVVCNVELYSCLSNLMKHFTFLANAYYRKIRGVKCTLTYFDLLEKHLKIDVRKVYSFHFEGTHLPSFNSPELREFSYSKKVNYTFYLKQCRPSIASKHFFVDILKNFANIDYEAKSLVQNKVYKIAVKNFQNISLTASCISFLETVGIKSEYLRVSVKAANILFHSGMDVDNIKTLFLNSEKDPVVIQTLLEEYLIKLIDFSDSMSFGSEFIKAVKLYDIVVKFSVLQNLPLPESFLRHLTQHNLWFPFILYAQLKNYPVHQIKELCSNFKNPNLLEHVIHSVMHDIQVNETNVLMRERDSRKYLLSKLGVRRTIDNTAGVSGSLRSRSTVSGSLESNSSSFGSETLEIDISNTKATLLQILIRCHNSTDPPKALLQACQLYRNPLLAILATSYEPDSVIINWLTWLAVSTDLYEIFTNFEALTASGQHVTDLLDNCIRNRFPKTLLQSFVIFIPNNPLMPFVDFLNKIISRDHETQYLTPKLDKFKASKSNRRASVISQTDYELTYLKNKVWIEQTALQLLCSAIIYNTNSHYEQLEFVELLCKIKIKEYFSCEIPKFNILLEILRIVFDTDIKLNINNYFDSSEEKETVQNCIDDLVKFELFDEAIKVARCSDMDSDIIVLKKWQNKFEQRKLSIQQFLIECDQDFAAQKVTSEYVISFFKERVSVDDLERYYLLKFSHKWAFNYSLLNRYELERKKILAFIKINENLLDLSELTEIDGGNVHMTYQEMIDALETVKPLQECLMNNCLEQLTVILNEFLDKGNFWFALKLERMFGCKSNALDILKLCHGLAEGLVLPYQLNAEQQRLIIKVKEIQRLTYRRRSLSYKGSSSVSSDKNYLDLIEEDAESPTQDTLGLIHSLTEKLQHGSDLAYSVFMKYRISCNIDVPYDLVVSTTDHIQLLKDALQDDCMNKSEVIHDFLEVFHWSKEEITDFVCEQFVRAASRYSKSKTEDFTMWDIRLAQQFHLVLKLFKDECSTLGYKLYNYASAAHQKQVTAELDFKISEMSLVVELLIAAHNCFTADCNMEGISTILRKCRTVISHLLTVRSWKLIVRLMTGVGRYTELNFVFHILKENDQFEFLLSRGSKRDEKLKLACVEYLKKYCPQNKELYKLVALHFTLYSEIGLVWEREALIYIKNLLAIAKAEMQNNRINVDTAEFLILTKSDGTSLLLDKAMETYVHASEFHMQGEKLAKAMNAAKQAELIALQKSLLRSAANNQTVPCLLLLSSTQILKLMCKELDFHQSYIVAQAYNHQTDWPQVLFEQVILNDNLKYFDLYNEIFGTSEQLVQDISRKFLTHSIKTPHGFGNMKYIIEKLISVNAKYRLASELGFTGLVAEIIEDEEISHLKDTVWKRGYKS